MSFSRGNVKVEELYVGITNRTLPFPDGKKPTETDKIYTITKDKKEIYGAPYVTLEAGHTYIFHVDAPGYPFYITQDKSGGGVLRQPMESLAGSIKILAISTGEKENIGIEKGFLRWSPDRNHSQMELFYQCNYYPHMGSSIVVKDE